ncbi:MAG: DinB family protein [Gemmatimonadota bacterium]|nr:DinB family protein [Gemmatimonadota bacterium]MDH5760124.1 DinB family protein [Gemmatimonadota bacterium]
METVADVIDALDRTPRLVVPLVREADPSILKRRPPSGKWSIHEHACHLAHVHELFFGRLDRFLAEDVPEFSSYDPGRDDDPDALLAVDLGEALERFTADRARLVERLRGLSDADWKRTARHSEYNHYSVFVLFRHAAFHDFLHAYRIEELVFRKDWPRPATP